MSSMLVHPEAPIKSGFFPLLGTDYLEFYVGNARQSAYYYRAAFGMSLVASAGPETGLHDRASYVVEQGGIRFVLTTPLRPDGGIADHIRRHGDGVRDIAFGVDDAKFAWREAMRRGARSIHECHQLEDEYGRVKLASIATYGDTIHTFVERGNYFGPFLPGYQPVNDGRDDCDPIARPVGLTAIDHIAANVGWNETRRWSDFYTDVLGFSEQSSSSARSVETSSLSTTITHSEGGLAFPIHEPARNLHDRKSPVERYLESYHGPGVQHIALSTDNILETVAQMRRQGVDFLPLPANHCGDVQARFGDTAEALDAGKNLGIVLDHDATGYLLQAVTRPVEDRPTLFFTIVQRKGCSDVGMRDLRSLTEADQTKRRY